LDFENRVLLPQEERIRLADEGAFIGKYFDPVLAANPALYHQFVSELFASGVVGFTTTTRCQAGVFFVSKKNDRLRVIVDARRTNSLCRRPPRTRLGSIEALCQVELDVGDGEVMWVAQQDVKDYFYRLGISRNIGEWFALPEVDGRWMQEILGAQAPAILGTGTVYPYLRVLPMGFSWAFWFAQEAHDHLTRKALGRGFQFVCDREPPPRLRAGPAAMIYADNGNYFGLTPDQADDCRSRCRRELVGVGLDVHEEEDATLLTETLGVRIQGERGVIGVKPLRVEVLHKALSRVAGGRPIYGHEL